MAGTGLALTGVMWGTDKVPDHWFENIPILGPKLFKEEKKYKAKIEDHYRGDESEMKSEKSRSTSRRYSNDDYEDDRSTTKGDGDKGYQSDDGHRRRNGHTRFDGGRHGTEDLGSHAGSRRSRDGGSRRSGSGERYGYGDDLGRRSSRMHNEPLAQRSPVPRYGGPLDRPPMGANVNGANAVGSPPPMGSPPQMYSPSFNSSGFQGIDPRGPPPTVQSTSTLRGGISTGYVPYAHLYGGPTHSQAQPQNGNYGQQPPSPFSPPAHPQPQNGNGYPPQGFPPSSQHNSPRPDSRHRNSPPPSARTVAPRPYHQNPFAQEAPPGNQPGYLIDPNHEAQRNNRDRDYDRQDTAASSRQSSPPRRHDSRRERRSKSHSRPRSRSASRDRDHDRRRKSEKEKQKPQRQKSLRDRMTAFSQSAMDKVSEFSSEFSGGGDKKEQSMRRRSRDAERDREWSRRVNGRDGRERKERRASQPARSRVSYDSD
ncbi:unnamed protein product [Zymoseptoria tritici ST99CH_3D1]|nr:unnamed protein product [Zymoseptoria tritici ST99CH_3D1]